MFNSTVEAVAWVCIVLIVAAGIVGYKYVESQRPAQLQAYETCMSQVLSADDRADFAAKCTDVALRYKEQPNGRGQ